MAARMSTTFLSFSEYLNPNPNPNPNFSYSHESVSPPFLISARIHSKKGSRKISVSSSSLSFSIPSSSRFSSSSFFGLPMAAMSDDVSNDISKRVTEKRNVVAQLTEPPSPSGAPSTSQPLTSPLPSPSFDPKTRSPLRPPEWVEEESERRERERVSLGGVSIRRRPPSGPSTHFVGPFEFRIENEYNVPRNILEEIVWHKDVEVARMREAMPLHVLMSGLKGVEKARDFLGALKERREETGVPSLIAEVKKASPSKGVIQPNFDPVKIAKAYEKGGAACLSVLTDSKYFQGSFENLKLIRASGVQCPLLCKEFIVDAYQLFFARLKGADAVLLISAVLNDQDLTYLTKIVRTLGMTALIEVHSEYEMDRVLNLEGVQLIGINNRNLETFEVDIANTKRLLEGERGERIRERGITVVGESGLFTPEDVMFVQEAGCGAILVGESLVKQNDPAAGIAGLFGKDISRVSV